MLSPTELRELCALCEATHVQFISDELYHGITFEGAPCAASAAEFSEQAPPRAPPLTPTLTPTRILPLIRPRTLPLTFP